MLFDELVSLGVSCSRALWVSKLLQDRHILLNPVCSRGTLEDVIKSGKAPAELLFSLQLAIGCVDGVAYLHNFSPPFIQ